MALGGFWGRLWLVLGAPEGLLGGVLASDKPISTIKTVLPSFDTFFLLVVVVAAAAVVVVVVAVGAVAAAAAVAAVAASAAAVSAAVAQPFRRIPSLVSPSH